MNQPGPYTQRIAAFAAAYTYAALPAAAVERAKEIILDTLGAMLLGSRAGYTGVRLLGDLARAEAGPPDCTVVGRDFRASLLSATLANGAMGYAADAEGGGSSRMHAAAVFVPAVLTAGESLRSSGRDVIAALSLAYDVGTRISDAAAPRGLPGTSYPHAFHPSAVFGHFGAAAAGGHLFGLNEAQFVNALGLAGINAGGMIAWVDDPTEDSRGFVIGVAAQNGIRAALLAKRGMGGPIRILDDAKYSIYDAYSGAMRLDRLLTGLGEEYRILAAGGYKQYPCCGDIHSGLDAFLSIVQKHRLQASQIESITHWVKPGRVDVIDDNFLKSHNSQYILAVAAVNGAIEPDDILIDRRQDATNGPAITSIYRRASLKGDPVLNEITDGAPAIVEVKTQDGRVLRERVDYAKGASRKNPLTQAELRAKFLRWATTRIAAAQAERIVELTGRLEQLDDIGELVALLAA